MSPSNERTQISDTQDAEQAIDNLNAVMDQLEAMVAEETAQVRGGHLIDAAGQAAAKAELARRYAIESERLQAARALIAEKFPQALTALGLRHESFRALLRTNLTVLATAHAVSEGIIRGVSGELARKRAPSTYGASGRATAPGARASQPLALSRTL